MNRLNSPDPVRRFLSSVTEARLESKRLKRRLQRLEDQATRMTANLTGMPRGGGDRENLLASLADMRIECDKAIIEAEKQEAAVTRFINKIDDPTSRIILKLRYCDCLDWDGKLRRRTVLSEMQKVGLYYERRHLNRLHGRALNEARELYKKEYGDEQIRDIG